MGDLVNLKRFKKRTARDDATRIAETNRARFGRTKVEKKRDKMRDERDDLTLDGHRITDEGPT